MLKNGQEVKIICGKDKGKSGQIIEILRNKQIVKVKGINFIKKHEKTTKEKKGGIITKENFIHISNVKSVNSNNEKNQTKESKKKK
jgi:large subunit ribosomal protein L24